MLAGLVRLTDAMQFPVQFRFLLCLICRIYTWRCFVAKVTWIVRDYTIAPFAVCREHFGFSSCARTEASIAVSSSECCKCWRITWPKRKSERERKRERREKREIVYAEKCARVSFAFLQKTSVFRFPHSDDFLVSLRFFGAATEITAGTKYPRTRTTIVTKPSPFFSFFQVCISWSFTDA